MNGHLTHYEFMKKFNLGLNSTDEIEQEVLNLMRGDNEKRYVKQKSYIKKCGHPGVRHNGACAFCEVIGRYQNDIQIAKKRVTHLREKAREMLKQAGDLQKRIEMNEMGLSTPLHQSVTRQEALAAGLKWYTPNNPCKHCGTFSERYVANGKCKGCKS